MSDKESIMSNPEVPKVTKESSQFDLATITERNKRNNEEIGFIEKFDIPSKDWKLIKTMYGDRASVFDHGDDGAVIGTRNDVWIFPKGTKKIRVSFNDVKSSMSFSTEDSNGKLTNILPISANGNIKKPDISNDAHDNYLASQEKVFFEDLKGGKFNTDTAKELLKVMTIRDLAKRCVTYNPMLGGIGTKGKNIKEMGEFERSIDYVANILPSLLLPANTNAGEKKDVLKLLYNAIFPPTNFKPNAIINGGYTR